MKRTVMLVDDQIVYRKAMITLLNKLGEVEIIAEASNGQEFLEKLDGLPSKPDIIFIDIEMPQMNGIEATAKAIAKYPDLLIIGLSIYDYEKYIDELIAAGAKGYLLKLSDNTQIFKTILQYPGAEIFFSKEIEVRQQKSEGEQAKTILVVDDFEANTYIIGHTLNNAGYNVIKAHSGEEALEFFKTSSIDLVVTDYKMPKMDGIELISRIKLIKGCENIPILLLTSETAEEKKKRAREVGVTGWIQKPFELKRFLDTVKKAIR